MILAAGPGSRLRPLTARTPKCMMPVGGRPLLEHILRRLGGYGVNDVVINLHHCGAAVREYFGDGRRFGVAITYSEEPRLLGTAGAVRKMARHFRGPFFVWYGDNLSRCRMDRLYRRHVEGRAALTVALFRRRDPAASGIAELDRRGAIVRFVEKPAPGEIFSHWVSAGIFVVEPAVLELLVDGQRADFGHDLIPAMLAGGLALCGYRLSRAEGLWWIDTPADYRRLARATHPLEDA